METTDLTSGREKLLVAGDKTTKYGEETNATSVAVGKSTRLASSVQALQGRQRAEMEDPIVDDSGLSERTCYSSCKQYTDLYYQDATLLEHFGYFCALALASYMGSIIRLYLKRLNEWSAWSLFPSFYTQIVGSFMLGFAMKFKEPVERRSKILYVAYATGLCGSITSFSSWNNEAVAVLLNVTQQGAFISYTPVLSGAARVVNWLTILIMGFAMPISSLQFGHALATYFAELALPRTRNRGGGAGGRHGMNRSTMLASTAMSSLTVEVKSGSGSRVKYQVLAAVALWITATILLLTIFSFFENENISDATDLRFLCIFSMLGTYIRWHLSPLNKAFVNKFMIGTFLVNVVGGWLQGAVLVVEEFELVNQNNTIAVGALDGVVYGFTSCLTTVSTFASELNGMSFGYGILYGSSSVLFAQTGIVVIRGLVKWLS